MRGRQATCLGLALAGVLLAGGGIWSWRAVRIRYLADLVRQTPDQRTRYAALAELERRTGPGSAVLQDLLRLGPEELAVAWGEEGLTACNRTSRTLLVAPGQLRVQVGEPRAIVAALPEGGAAPAPVRPVPDRSVLLRPLPPGGCLTLLPRPVAGAGDPVTVLPVSVQVQPSTGPPTSWSRSLVLVAERATTPQGRTLELDWELVAVGEITVQVRNPGPEPATLEPGGAWTLLAGRVRDTVWCLVRDRDGAPVDAVSLVPAFSGGARLEPGDRARFTALRAGAWSTRESATVQAFLTRQRRTGPRCRGASPVLTLPFR